MPLRAGLLASGEGLRRGGVRGRGFPGSALSRRPPGGSGGIGPEARARDKGVGEGVSAAGDDILVRHVVGPNDALVLALGTPIKGHPRIHPCWRNISIVILQDIMLDRMGSDLL